jgi:outer membrane protein insertion porin family
VKSHHYLREKIIRSIQFENTGTTKKHVLRRELELKENKEWNLKKARRSVTNLYSTGIFNNVNLSVSECCRDSIDVVIDLIEKPGGTLNFSANYNNELNASAMISYRMLNLFDLGIVNNFSFLFNEYKQKFSVDLISPRIFETILTNSMNFHTCRTKFPIYLENEKITENTVRQLSMSVNLGLQIRRIGLTSVGINQVFFDVNENNTAIPVIKSSRYNVTRLVARIDVDNTNDYDLPTRGNKNSILYEQSLKNENLEPYFKFSATTRNYETYDNITYSTLLHFGYLSLAPYYFEKFSLGGQNSFPGLNLYQRWGNMVFVSGMALRFPVTKGIYTNLQFKVGNVWDDLQEFKLTDFNWGAQFGLIVPTPIGAIRMDYGANLEGLHAFYFSIGHSF